MAELRHGDRVRWNTPQGETTGTVVRRLTSPCDVGGQHVAASPDDPRFLVRSERSGREAAHRAEALTRVEP